MEEALYDSVAMRDFVGIDLGREPVPDETTVCRFRHLLEEPIWGGSCSTGLVTVTIAGLKGQELIRSHAVATASCQ